MQRYGNPQILEVFKNTMLSRLCWLVLGMKNLTAAVDSVKGILTKEKQDRQMLGKGSAASPFFKIRQRIQFE